MLTAVLQLGHRGSDQHSPYRHRNAAATHADGVDVKWSLLTLIYLLLLFLTGSKLQLGSGSVSHP